MKKYLDFESKKCKKQDQGVLLVVVVRYCITMFAVVISKYCKNRIPLSFRFFKKPLLAVQPKLCRFMDGNYQDRQTWYAQSTQIVVVLPCFIITYIHVTFSYHQRIYINLYLCMKQRRSNLRNIFCLLKWIQNINNSTFFQKNLKP